MTIQALQAIQPFKTTQAFHAQQTLQALKKLQASQVIIYRFHELTKICEIGPMANWNINRIFQSSSLAFHQKSGLSLNSQVKSSSFELKFSEPLKEERERGRKKERVRRESEC